MISKFRAAAAVVLRLAVGVMGVRDACVDEPTHVALKGSVGRRREFMRRAVGLLLALTMLSERLEASRVPPAPFSVPKGTVVFYPEDFHRGWEIFAIVRLKVGGYEVFYAKEHLYQDATVSGEMIDGTKVAIQYLEIIANLPAAAAASRPGFRSADRIERYPLREWSAQTKTQTIDVRANGSEGFLIVIKRYGDAS